MSTSDSIQILLSDRTLQLQSVMHFVTNSAAGGINVFVGNVRDQTQGKTVQRLEFEAYVPMAEQELRKIAEQAVEAYQLTRIALHHRLGTLYPPETAVLIAAAAPHRDAAFAACRFAIDTLKQTVPIWKKEIFTDGEVWVAAHP